MMDFMRYGRRKYAPNCNFPQVITDLLIFSKSEINKYTGLKSNRKQ